MINKKELEKITQEFFKYFDSKAEVSISEEDGWRARVKSENSAILIGKKGETLEIIQNLIRAIVSKKAGEFTPVVVDIGDFKERHESGIKELALQMAENVKNSGYAQEMRPMSAYERRIVHVALKDFTGIKADSVGDGLARRIKIEKI
jgi:spoIIIJ-associated protein